MLNISDERRQMLVKEMGLESLPKIIQDEHIETFENIVEDRFQDLEKLFDVKIFR